MRIYEWSHTSAFPGPQLPFDLQMETSEHCPGRLPLPSHRGSKMICWAQNLVPPSQGRSRAGMLPPPKMHGIPSTWALDCIGFLPGSWGRSPRTVLQADLSTEFTGRSGMKRSLTSAFPGEIRLWLSQSQLEAVHSALSRSLPRFWFQPGSGKVWVGNRGARILAAVLFALCA